MIDMFGVPLYIEPPPENKGFKYTNSYWKRFLAANLCRANGFIYLWCSWYIYNEIWNARTSSDYLFPATIILLVAFTLFIYGEYDYVVYGPSARPIKLFSNGILLPPIYTQHLKKDKGMIHRSDISEIRVLRRHYYGIPDSDVAETVYRNGPVKIELRLKNGKKKRTSFKSPIVIMEITKVLREKWGISIVDDGEGMGLVERVVNGKVIDTRKI